MTDTIAPYIEAQADAAFSNWAWLRDGEPIGYLASHVAARLAFKAGAEWAEQRSRSLSLSAAPEGWKLVPVEPTPEMLQAGQGWDGLHSVWKRMLAAAPLVAEQCEVK